MGEGLLKVKGLDGLDDSNQTLGDLREPEITQRYKNFEKQRKYSLK